MKKLQVVIYFLVLVLFGSCHRQHRESGQLVNALLGDISFIKKFGRHPGPSDNENVRIQTHLEYVEHMLRQKDVSGFSANLRQRREKMIDLLHDYWVAGTFPRNYDYKDMRKPCFIDKEGRICAVGYLVEKTAGRQVAEEINQKYKYEEILAMNDPMVENWIRNSGLTREECAMIQPTYSPPPVYGAPDYSVSPGYAVFSSLFMGTNASLGIVNAVQIGKGNNGSKAVGVLGLISGLAQLTMGGAMFSANGDQGDWNSRKTLSVINLSMGTSTFLLSVGNLMTNRHKNEQPYTWNVFGYPTPDKKMGVGFTFTRRL